VETRWARSWKILRGFAERIADAASTNWTEATKGRSYALDYMGMDLQALLGAAKVKVLPLGRDVRYVVTSDHHRRHPGPAGGEADAAWIAAHRALYEQALHFYARNGFTLIEAGDMEELWRLGPGIYSWNQAWEQIRTSYEPVYQQIRDQFANGGRYLRLWGNHDAVWRHDKYCRQYLAPVLGQIEPYEMALIGERFLVMHGQAVDRWNNDRRGWWLGRLFSRTPIHIDAINHAIADPDGTYPNWVGGRHRNDWLARPQNSWLGRKLLGSQRFHPFRAVECDHLYVQWARNLGLSLICGHTHEPALFPRDSEGRQTPYLNCGSGLSAQELQAIEIRGDGDPVPVKWTAMGRQEICFRPPSVAERRAEIQPEKSKAVRHL
jgi:UDP-2,3-diacylglucosamine pyrophosphatase LpxH